MQFLAKSQSLVAITTSLRTWVGVIGSMCQYLALFLSQRFRIMSVWINFRLLSHLWSSHLLCSQDKAHSPQLFSRSCHIWSLHGLSSSSPIILPPELCAPKHHSLVSFCFCPCCSSVSYSLSPPHSFPPC